MRGRGREFICWHAFSDKRTTQESQYYMSIFYFYHVDLRFNPSHLTVPSRAFLGIIFYNCLYLWESGLPIIITIPEKNNGREQRFVFSHVAEVWGHGSVHGYCAVL